MAHTSCMVLSGPLIDVESFSRITADTVDRGDVRNAKLKARQMYPSCKGGSDDESRNCDTKEWG